VSLSKLLCCETSTINFGGVSACVKDTWSLKSPRLSPRSCISDEDPSTVRCGRSLPVRCAPTLAFRLAGRLALFSLRRCQGERPDLLKLSEEKFSFRDATTAWSIFPFCRYRQPTLAHCPDCIEIVKLDERESIPV